MRLVLFLLAIGGLLLLLQWQFPYAITTNGQWLSILYMVLWLLLICGGGWGIRRQLLSQTLKFAVIWLAILVGLVMAYSFRDNLGYNRLVAELLPDRVQEGRDGSLNIRRSMDGQFHIEGEVNGVPVGFIVDTGASDIVLSPHDGERVGFLVYTLNYSHTYDTANGPVSAAPVMLDTLAIGPVTLNHVQASVNGTPMDESLLGLSFLDRMKSYSVHGNTLTLRP